MEPDGWLDLELSGPLTPPLAIIRGWALAERGLDSIEVALDDGEAVRARLFSTPRPDLAASASEPSAPIAGWEALIGVDAKPGSVVRVTATAGGEGERAILGSGELTVGPSSRTAVEDPDWVGELAERAAADAASGPAPACGERRLLVFAHRLDIGGAQSFLRQILSGLLSDPGTRCLVLAPGDGAERRRLERLGAHVHVTGPLPSEGPAYESRIRELVLLARSFGANVVLANTTLSFIGVDLARRLDIPSVWAIHESAPIEDQLNAPIDDHLRERFLAALGSADRLAFAADATLDVYRPYADQRRMVRIDYGVDLAAVDAGRASLDRDRLRAEHGFGPDDRLLVCVANLEPRKGQAMLALALARLAERHPDARLALIGDSESEYSTGLHEALARLEHAERVTIEPVTSDPSTWYAIADAFVLASDIESLPLSLLEAMAFGLPVLAAGVFGIAGLIEDGVNGILCEPRSLGSLTGGLDRLLSLDPDRLAALGAAGRDSVSERHDLERVSVSQGALLTGLGGGGRRSGNPGSRL